MFAPRPLPLRGGRHLAGDALVTHPIRLFGDVSLLPHQTAVTRTSDSGILPYPFR